MSDLATQPGIIHTGTEEEWSKGNGWENTENFEGTEAQARAKRDQMLAAGATRVRFGPKGNGAWTCRGMFPFNPQKPDTNYVDVMDLETSAITRSAFQSPVLRKRFSDYNSIYGTSVKCDAVCVIVGDLHRKYLAGLPKQETNGKFKYWTGAVFAEANTRELALDAEFNTRMAAAGIAGNDKTIAQKFLYSLDARGTTSFVEFNSVFRRRVTAGSPAAIRGNNEGVGKVWTTAELITWEGIPAWFDLDPAMQWHKDKPRVVHSYGQKTQLSYNYVEIRTATWLHYEAYGSALLIDVVP